MGCAAGVIGDLFKTAFGTHVVELIRLDAKVRDGNDAEALHDARVAVRRLRSYLRTFRPILVATWAYNLRSQLGWLNDRFAAARDLDMLVEILENRPSDEPPPAGLLERLRAERDERHASVQADLRHPQYIGLLEEIVAAARRPLLGIRASKPARASMPKLMASVWNRACKRVRGFGRSPTDAQLHAIRIRVKHVRYAAECFEPLAGKRARLLARHAERLQSVLGHHHDAVVAAARLHEFSQMPPGIVSAPKPPAWRPVWRKMRGAYERLEESIS